MSAPSSHAPAIELKGLAYRYPDGREALRGLTLAINKGESVALIGPNGAGKSTLLWHLNGLLPHRAAAKLVHSHDAAPAEPDSGPSVWIDGIALIPRSAHEARRRVGLLFQDPDDQLFSVTVLEDVAFGPLNLGRSRKEARELARDCLERVGLPQDVAERPPHHLSYGERKRACLAGVLACSPTILALDEPTANLDPRARRRFIELVRSLDATKVIATHDLEMTLELCSRAILLDGGRVIADGPSEEILRRRDVLEEHGLEVPLSLRYENGKPRTGGSSAGAVKAGQVAFPSSADFSDVGSAARDGEAIEE